MYGPHDIRRIVLDGILVATTHDRLRSHMNNNFGTALGDRTLKSREVANVGANRADGARNPRLLEQVRLSRRIERVAGNLGSERIQPQRQPTSLETGMSGQEDAAALPECAVKPHRTPAAVTGCRDNSCGPCFATGQRALCSCQSFSTIPPGIAST